MKAVSDFTLEPFETSDYIMPTQVYFGRGKLSILLDKVNLLPISKFLFVSGGHFINDHKNKEFLSRVSTTGKVDIYKENIRKSSFEEVNKLIRTVQDKHYQGVIGLGGGAILDSTKVAASLAINGGIAEDYLINNTKKIDKKGITFIAIPTTSGTGSEVTPWSVIWGDKKYSLSSPFMFPDIAIVDSELTDNCPKGVTATAGIDAMVQAVEAYWNIKHNSTSDKFALDSIKIIMKSLPSAVNNPTPNTRDAMAWGSLMGGLAFSNTATTICHSVSYPMTSHWGIPHGQATSITLPMFMEYSFEVLGKREDAILKAFGAKNVHEAANKVKALLLSIGLRAKLSELGIPRSGIETIVQEGFDPSRAGNAPKVPSPAELHQMLESIY